MRSPNAIQDERTSPLVHLMLRINGLIGNPRTFAAICLFTAAWIVAIGLISHADPWPFVALLTLVNLPQLPIMVALQVSANRQASHAEIKADIDHALQMATHTEVKELTPQQRWQVEALQLIAAKVGVELPAVPSNQGSTRA